MSMRFLCKENSFNTENDYFYQKKYKNESIFDVSTTSRNMVSKFLSDTILINSTRFQRVSNNLIWNIGHIIVSQQLLVYKLSVCHDGF
jgi:hypothetical protein